jgi:hypothetical protein
VVGITGVDKTIGVNAVMIVLKRRMATLPPPEDQDDGWKADPLGRAQWRWWAGRWTEQVVNAAGKPETDWPFRSAGKR